MVTSPLSDTSMAGSRCSVSHSSQVSRNAPSAGTGVIPAATNASETRTSSSLPRLYRERPLAALRRTCGRVRTASCMCASTTKRRGRPPRRCGPGLGAFRCETETLGAQPRRPSHREPCLSAFGAAIFDRAALRQLRLQPSDRLVVPGLVRAVPAPDPHSDGLRRGARRRVPRDRRRLAAAQHQPPNAQRWRTWLARTATPRATEPVATPGRRWGRWRGSAHAGMPPWPGSRCRGE